MTIQTSPRKNLRREHCFFYHAMDLPGLGTVRDQGWDLRGTEAQYLGDVQLSGKRILEIGPANGALSFYAESCGAKVVAVELASSEPWDGVPHSDLDLSALAESQSRVMDEVRNGFWLAHELLGSKVEVYYGTAYQLPDELGQFDVAVMASVLLHMRDPMKVLMNCASRTNERLIVVERFWPELADEPIVRLEPTIENGVWDTWWSFSPGFFKQICPVLGFTKVDVTFHEAKHYWQDGDAMMPMFTVVAAR